MHQTITLPNGARLLTEAIPGVRTAALGFFVGVGSRHEKAAENGAAHFIEHMLFKGTRRRTAAQLAQEMDAVGGQFNAYTTKESTCFYFRCLDEHLDRGTELLCDLFFDARFDQADVDTERGVILEEIGMYEDTPEDLCAERLAAAIYHGSSLARPILGRRSTLNKMDGDWLRAWRDTHYAPRATVAALAGNFTPEVVDRLAQRLAALEDRPAADCRPAAYTPAWTVKRKAIEQNHLTLAFPALDWNHPRRYELQLLVNILGGGMSSRLFQEVREKRGLCYTTYAYSADHADLGVLGVYAALGRETEAQALDAIRGVICALADHGPTQAEVDRSREQCKANVLMGLESVQARMSHLGRSELLLGTIETPDEIIARYDAVTRAGVHSLARELLDFDRVSLSAVGRVAGAEEYQRWLGL
jgi:predicted Zn-dependent peptidase